MFLVVPLADSLIESKQMASSTALVFELIVEKKAPLAPSQGNMLTFIHIQKSAGTRSLIPRRNVTIKFTRIAAHGSCDAYK